MSAVTRNVTEVISVHMRYVEPNYVYTMCQLHGRLLLYWCQSLNGFQLILSGSLNRPE